METPRAPRGWGEPDLRLARLSPFIAVAVLGFSVFTGHATLNRTVDLSEWRANQQILLLIENCQDGQMSMSSCREQIPPVLDQCKESHVLACDDHRLTELLGADKIRAG